MPAAPGNQTKPLIIRERKKRKQKWTAKRIVLTVVIALAVALVLAVAAYALSVYQSGKNMQVADDVSVEAPSTAISYTEGQTVEYNGHTYTLNKSIVSLVFMGIHVDSDEYQDSANGQADAVMALAIDSSTGKITVISIPRDSMVDVDTYSSSGAYTGIQNMQLCLAYNYGDDDNASAQNVASAVSRALYSMPMNYYYAIDISGVGPMADAIGGVPLTALSSIPGTDIDEGEGVILTGDNAKAYVQYRDTTVLDSAIDRQERQKQFVNAFVKQAMSRAQGNAGDLVNLFGIAQEYSTTNLGITEFTYLATIMLNNGVDEVSAVTLGGETVQGASGYAEYHLDRDAVYQTVLDVFYTQTS